MLSLRALLIIMVLSLCVVSEPRQHPSDAPYIYYFSERLNSYVIERADGTETRLLGQRVTKAPTTARYAYYISGPGWSPSGRWLAWQRKDFNEGGVTLGVHSYAVRIGDNRRLMALDKFPNAEMVWSPTQDLLFVVSSNYESKMGNLPTHQPGMIWLSFGLIDAEKDDVIYSETQGVRSDGGYGLAYPDAMLGAIQWLDTQHVVVGYRWFPLTGDEAGYTLYFRTFDLQNHTSKTIAFDDSYNLIGAAANFRLTSGAISRRGDVLFTKKDQLFIHNFLDDSERALGTSPGKSLTVAWSPDGRYGLLQSANVELLEVATGKRIVLSQATPYRLGDYYYNDGSRQQTWSPDGKHLLFISGQHFYHYDLAQTRLDELPFTFDPKQRVNYPGWEWRSNTTVSLVWSNPSQPSDYDSAATRCDFAEGVHCITPPAAKAQYGRGDVTMDGRYRAFVYEGPEITDTTTHQTTLYRSPYFAYNAARAGEARFHPTLPWLLTFRHGLVASGGDCCRHYGIIRADGAYQRDLGFMMGLPEPIVLDWLPERVPIAELGSSTQVNQFKPDQLIPGKDWASALLWDEDSERLLLFDGYTGGVYVADRLTGKNQRVFERKGGGDPYWAFDPASGVSLPAHGGTQTPYNPRYEPVWHQNGGTHSIDIVDKATKIVICNLGEDGMRDAWFVIPDAQNRIALIGSPYTVAEVWDIQRCQKVVQLAYPVQAAAWSPDGHWLAVTASWEVHLYAAERFHTN